MEIVWEINLQMAVEIEEEGITAIGIEDLGTEDQVEETPLARMDLDVGIIIPREMVEPLKTVNQRVVGVEMLEETVHLSNEINSFRLSQNQNSRHRRVNRYGPLAFDPPA